MHTKGNWHAHDGQVYPEETGKTLALIPYFNKESEEDNANANLIAAAPELLKACRKALDQLYQANDALDLAGIDFDGVVDLQNAINKVEGK
jgi:hypothetical protein